MYAENRELNFIVFIEYLHFALKSVFYYFAFMCLRPENLSNLQKLQKFHHRWHCMYFISKQIRYLLFGIPRLTGKDCLQSVFNWLRTVFKSVKIPLGPAFEQRKSYFLNTLTIIYFFITLNEQNGDYNFNFLSYVHF